MIREPTPIYTQFNYNARRCQYLNCLKATFLIPKTLAPKGAYYQ